LYIQTISDTKAFKMDVLQSKKMNKIHISYILQLSMITLALFIITTSQVKAQQGQDSHGLTPEQVKQFCRSDNPRLSFVNHTESEICGLPESTPSTPASNSSGSSSGSSPSSSGSITPQAP
jgi:hypothetical protein